MVRKNKDLIKGMSIIWTAFFILSILAKKCKEFGNIDLRNPYLEVSSISEELPYANYYEKYIKRMVDIFLSFVGLIVLMPVYGVISAVIYLDDPGPIFFIQKRIGKDKHYIYIHKFRTMQVDTPHNVPTHQLSNPEQYITKVGKILRKYSLDELPQIWDIFRGCMSIIGPRPALWNQYDLVAERDKYGANNVMPGLTGWAQINGRDELNIKDKAKLDGYYVQHLKSRYGFLIDIKCFFRTISLVIKHDGVVEGRQIN